MENAHVGLFGWRGLNAISENIPVAIGLIATRATPYTYGIWARVVLDTPLDSYTAQRISTEYAGRI